MQFLLIKIVNHYSLFLSFPGRSLQQLKTGFFETVEGGIADSTRKQYSPCWKRFRIPWLPLDVTWFDFLLLCHWFRDCYFCTLLLMWRRFLFMLMFCYMYLCRKYIRRSIYLSAEFMMLYLFYLFYLFYFWRARKRVCARYIYLFHIMYIFLRNPRHAPARWESSQQSQHIWFYFNNFSLNISFVTLSLIN